MGILCSLIGHKWPRAYYRFDRPYAEPVNPDVWRDGTGRGHIRLHLRCDRCDAKFHVLNMHPPKEWKTP